MLDAQTPTDHVEPFIQQDSGFKVLHFSIREVQSRMRLDDPCALELEYCRTMMGFLLFKPSPRHITMIGLGGGSLAKFCHRHLPATRVVVIEINPHVLALRDEFQIPPDDDRLTVLRGDGAIYVRSAEVPCDVLMVDGFDYDGQPAALSSQAFYDACFEHLQADGILVVNLFSRHKLHDVFVDRLRRSFAEQVLIIHDQEAGNSVAFAFKGPGLHPGRKDALRPPKQLDEAAARQLANAFSLVLSTLNDQRL